MGVKVHSWISFWFAVTLPVILWDASYCFMRPRSFVGGDLHWIWAPYTLWQEIDHVYGLPSFERGDGFTNAQSLMNIFETAANVLYLYLVHHLPAPSPVAPLVGYSAALCTLAKTVLYWAQEYYCDFCAIGHNGVPELALWVLMNGLWIVVPLAIVIQLASDISHHLLASGRVETAHEKEPISSTKST